MSRWERTKIHNMCGPKIYTWIYVKHITVVFSGMCSTKDRWTARIK